MSSPIESGESGMQAAQERQAALLVTLPMVLIGIAVSVYGIVRHNSFCWNIGPIMVASPMGTWLSNRRIRRSKLPLTPFDEAMINVGTYLPFALLALLVTIGFMFLFPNWFSD